MKDANPKPNGNSFKKNNVFKTQKLIYVSMIWHDQIWKYYLNMG